MRLASDIARSFPAAMLFVRNEKGISHSPLENMTEEDGTFTNSGRSGRAGVQDVADQVG